jgi:hypothetical protein
MYYGTNAEFNPIAKPTNIRAGINVYSLKYNYKRHPDIPIKSVAIID